MKRLSLNMAVVIATAAIVCSCHKEPIPETIVATDFPVKENLVGERVELDRAECLSGMVEPAGNYLVFNAIRSAYCFQVYDRDFKLVDTLFTKLGGPDEFPDGATYYGQWHGKETDPSLLVFCAARRQLASITIPRDSAITTVMDVPVSEDLTPSSIYQLSDSTYAGITLAISEGASPFIYNAETNSVRKPQPPFTFAENANMFYMTQQTLGVDYAAGRLCTAYNRLPWMVMYDFDFNVIRKIAVMGEVDTATATLDQRYPGLIHPSFYNGHLMVIYVPADGKNCSLLVFDKEGVPEASYMVDDAIWYLIDESGDRLLTVHYDNEKDFIYLRSNPIPALLTAD